MYRHVLLGGESVKTPNKSWKEVLTNGLMVTFFFRTFAIALKFVTFFNHWVYFPYFPNSLDSAFLISGSAYFFGYILYKKRQWDRADIKATAY
jgi:hypothetical protein